MARVLRRSPALVPPKPLLTQPLLLLLQELCSLMICHPAMDLVHPILLEL